MTENELIATFNTIERILSKAKAYDIIDTKSEEALEYCRKYIQVDAWGSNIWHAILRDAIRMREELNNTKQSIYNAPQK